MILRKKKIDTPEILHNPHGLTIKKNSMTCISMKISSKTISNKTDPGKYTASYNKEIIETNVAARC